MNGFAFEIAPQSRLLQMQPDDPMVQKCVNLTTFKLFEVDEAGKKKEEPMMDLILAGSPQGAPKVVESWKDVEVNKAKRWPTGSLQTMKEDGDENDKSCEVCKEVCKASSKFANDGKRRRNSKSSGDCEQKQQQRKKVEMMMEQF